MAVVVLLSRVRVDGEWKATIASPSWNRVATSGLLLSRSCGLLSTVIPFRGRWQLVAFSGTGAVVLSAKRKRLSKVCRKHTHK
jgi:hypothetical protein